MQNLWLDPRRRTLKQAGFDPLGLAGPGPSASLRTAPCSSRDRQAELQRLKMRLHRFFATLPQHPL